MAPRSYPSRRSGRAVFRTPAWVPYWGRRRRAPLSRAQAGSGVITAVAALTGAGTKHAAGTGTITAAASLSGAGTEHSTGVGSITATTTIPPASGVKNGIGAGAITASASLSGQGVGVVPGQAHFAFAVDWDGDGTFDDPGEDVTERVLARHGFSCDFGRDQARALAPPASGRAAGGLNNISGDYSPDRTDSPLAGDLLPARELLCTVELDGAVSTLFRGHLDDYQVKVERNVREVEFTALDSLAKLKGTKISTLLYSGIRTGTAIDLILDAVGWPAELRDLDPGATLIRWWWEEQTDAWEALLALVESEGPGAIVHADPDGKVVFRDRHHRLLAAGSTASQATITDGAGGYEPAFSGMTYDHGWKEVINQVTISVEERDPSPEPETVWESADVRSIAAGETLELTVQANEPVLYPAVDFDVVSAGSASSAIVQTSGQALTLQITAGGSAIAVANIVVTAQPVAVRRTIQVQAEDAASADKYGQRALPHTAKWAGVHDAAAIADLIIGARAERLPIVEVRFSQSRSPVRMAQQYGRDLSDRVHLVETETGVDQDFFVEQIKHRISGGGFTETTFGCEQAVYQPDSVFTFDDGARGFNDGVFGSPGLDQPADLFLFDVTGQGFNDGVLAT